MLNPKRTRALVVEDNPGDAFLVREHLESSDPPFDIESVEDLSTAMRSLSIHKPDVVLLDLNLPDSSGSDTVRTMIRKAPQVPVLVLTGQDDEELGIQAVHEGAQDYLVKGRLDSRGLARAIKYAIERQGLLLALNESREQQLQFKDQLLSHVSHELRSPLTCIHQFVSILLDSIAGPLNSEQREYLETALKSANQLRTMINDLLEAATIEAGKLKLELKCVLLDDLVKQAVEMLHASAAAKEITLEYEVPMDPLFVHADPHRVLQVLLNLLENALKFTPTNGVVTVHSHQTDPAFVLISVKDTGCGITAQAQPLVFERLYQEENTGDAGRKGLGLGLSICKDLVTRQGGKIWLESSLGRGTTFFFTLPVFSLSKLLTPILVQNRVVQNRVSLVIAKLAPTPVTAAIEAWGKTRREFLDLLQRCILPDKDVLLPSMGHPEMGEFFFIVAATDAAGSEVLTKRIRELASRRPEVAANSVLNVSSESLEVFLDDKRCSAEDAIEEITKLIVRRTTQILDKGKHIP